MAEKLHEVRGPQKAFLERALTRFFWNILVWPKIGIFKELCWLGGVAIYLDSLNKKKFFLDILTYLNILSSIANITQELYQIKIQQPSGIAPVAVFMFVCFWSPDFSCGPMFSVMFSDHEILVDSVFICWSPNFRRLLLVR